jgi:hypothetical protein
VQVYQPAGNRGKTPVAHPERECPPPAEDALPGRHDARHVTPGILPSALRASLRLFKIAPSDFVEPLDFIARLAALVPKPRVNLTRFHGVFAPNSSYRARVTPAKRARGSQHAARDDREDPHPPGVESGGAPGPMAAAVGLGDRPP